jgi:hypothetical protein
MAEAGAFAWGPEKVTENTSATGPSFAASSGDSDVVEQRAESDLTPTLEFIPLEKIQQRKGIKILLYGANGVGKTRFCLGSEEPICIIDTEHGVAPLASLAKGKTVSVVPIAKINAKTFELDSVASLSLLERAIFEATASKKFRTVCVDSVTSVWSWLQDWLRYEVVRGGGKINIKGVPSDRRDWAKANSKYLAFMMNLMSADANVILTAQSHPVYDQQGQLTGETKPSYQKNTPFLVDMALELFKTFDGTKMKFYARVDKCRFSHLDIVGKTIEEPTFDKIKALIEGTGGVKA